MMEQKNSKTADFLFEMAMLKRQRRSGWHLLGKYQPESIADHSWRAAIIGYLLADMEKADANKVAIICLIHDIPECRTMDQHKVASRYYSQTKAEHHAFSEQIKNLSDSTAQKWKQLYSEYEKRNTPEGIIAKDADWLETALTARELLHQGFPEAKEWIQNVKKALETKSAKKLLAQIEKNNPNGWWQGLKKMTYKKL